MDPAPASSESAAQAQSAKGPKSVQIEIADEDGDNSPTTITFTSGGRSSGGSISANSGSFSSASSDSIRRGYVTLDRGRDRYQSPDEDEEDDEDDDIEPSDSASRSRRTTSRRHTTEVRPAPTRRHSSRRVDREELPRRHSSHRAHHSSRSHRRSEPRRTASDESSSVASSYYDEAYGHHGAPQPPRAPYPPATQSGYRHVPAQSHGGYPPSITSAPYSHDAFAHQQALVQMAGQDAFGAGYPPSQNPFSPHNGPQNPFSPMSAAGGSSYFPPDPHAMPGAPMPPPQRPHGPSRPQSFAAPSQFGASHYGSDMAMAHYPGSVHPSMAPPSVVPPSVAPGMPGYPYGFPGMPGYSLMPYQYPSSHAASPAPPAPAAPAPEKKEEKKEEKNERDEKTSAEIQALKDLIAKHEEARLAAEAERLAKAEADAAAAAAKKAAEEAEKKKKEEIAAASKKAKEDAEKKAEEAAKKAKEEHEKAAAAAKEEHEKKLAELQKAHDDAEKKQKELEAEVEKSKPAPDSLKDPIKFKDAVGRKFSFPWHLCKTWKGMEGLIKQAFLHVDVIGEHVHAGHYDLTGPDGEIILPQVWDTMVNPGWEISMHMWPMPDPEPPKKEDKLAHDLAHGMGDPFGVGGLDFSSLGLDPIGKKKGGKTDKKKKRQSMSPEIINIAPMPPAPGPGSPTMPPPPPMPAGMPGFDFPMIVEDKKTGRPKAKSKGGKEISGLTAWMIGGAAPRAKKDDEKLDLAKPKSPTAHLPSSKNGAADQTNCILM